jgi:hypothetical protein
VAVAKKDMYQFQRERVERIARELDPRKAAEFEETSARRIRFRVRDAATGVDLTGVCGEWFPDELAGKSDDRIRAYIIFKELGNEKL